MSTDPVVIEQSFDVEVAKVWDAITNPDQMRQWYFTEIEDFQPQTGFETQFDVDCEGTIYTHCWTVREVVPLERISYQWRYLGRSGDSAATWDLTVGENATLLHFSHEVLEPFPADDPNFSREAAVTGWDYFINDRLKDFLERHDVTA